MFGKMRASSHKFSDINVQKLTTLRSFAVFAELGLIS